MTSDMRTPQRRRPRADSGGNIRPVRRRHSSKLSAVERLEPRHLLAALPIITEFAADNDRGLIDGDGQASDWIELYNAGDEPIDLAGWHLTDDAEDLTKWTFPADLPAQTRLSPGDLRVVFATGEHTNEQGQIVSPYVDAGGSLHANFRIAAGGEYLALVEPRGTTDAVVSSFGTSNANFPPQLTDVTYGQSGRVATHTIVDLESVAELLVPTNDALGREWTGAPDNEPFPTSPETTDWEITTAGVGFERVSDLVPLAYWSLDGDAADTIGQLDGNIAGATFANNEIPAARQDDVTLAAVFDGAEHHIDLSAHTAAFAELTAGTISAWFRTDSIRKQTIISASDASDRARSFELFVESGSLRFDVQGDAESNGELISSRIDTRSVSDGKWHHAAVTVGADGVAHLFLDGAEVNVQAEPFFAAVNDIDQLHIGHTISSRGADSVFEGLLSEVAVWNQPLTADQIRTLAEGESPTELSGFSRLIRTNVADAMWSVGSSAYVRIPFEVESKSATDQWLLNVAYDDGYVAYVNGVEVARAHAPDQLDSASTAPSPGAQREIRHDEHDISEIGSIVSTTGVNVLAIHALNEAAEDNDFLMAPTLSQVRRSIGPEPRFFTEPTPGSFNSVGVTGFASAATANVDRGVYQAADLEAGGALSGGITLSTVTPEAQIIYTLDGTAPSMDPDGTLANGSIYEAPIAVTGTTTVRARVVRPEFEPSEIRTFSYIVIDDVLEQSRSQLDPDDYPDTWGSHIDDNEPPATVMGDYEVDPEIVNDPRYADEVLSGLTAIPTLSVVMDPEALFSERTGIYWNSAQRGVAWERAASVELLHPDGTEGFSVNAGIRTHGGASRDPNKSPKHSLRLLFKDEYGDTKLRYPLFGPEGNNEFDTLVLRAGYNDSWIMSEPTQRREALYFRDQFVRDSQLAMGQPSARGMWVHLYLNGIYWGLYNPSERPGDDFQARNFGGNREDYDVIVHGGVQSGSRDAWNRVLGLASAGLESPETYAEFNEYVDVVSLADYILLNLFVGTADWPGNNWYAARPRVPGGQFRFFVWDAEMSLKALETDRTGIDSANSAAFLFRKARENPEFQLLFADRVQKHMYGDGALTPHRLTERFQRLQGVVEPVIALEAARWGDTRTEIPHTPDNDWFPTIAEVIPDFFNLRGDIFLEHLEGVDLLSSIPPPIPSLDDGSVVTPGTQLEMSAHSIELLTESTIIPVGADADYLVPADAGLDDQWFLSAYSIDDAWSRSPMGIGFESTDSGGLNPGITTNIQSTWDTHQTSVYTRQEFAVPTDVLNADSQLVLQLQFDDGFVAYLNGQRVADSGNLAESPPTFNTNSTSARRDADVLEFVEFDLSEHVGLLRTSDDAGDALNVLAIQTVRRNANDRDLLISSQLVVRTSQGFASAPVYVTTDGTDPRQPGGAVADSAVLYGGPIEITEPTSVNARILEDGQWSPLVSRELQTSAIPATAENFRISEIHYHPGPPTVEEATAGHADDNDFEFLEFWNLSDQPIDLTDIHLTRIDGEGVDFSFAGGAVEQLGANERVVVVEDLAAFRFRYGNDVLVAGQWSGGLANSTELITVQQGTLNIQQIRYRDAWQPTTDGSGGSLEFVGDVATSLDAWSAPVNWQASRQDGGTPGSPPNPPGDVNFDGVFTLEDLALVAAAGEYEDGISMNSTWAEGDWNGDGEFDSQDFVFAFQTGMFF